MYTFGSPTLCALRVPESYHSHPGLPLCQVSLCNRCTVNIEHSELNGCAFLFFAWCNQSIVPNPRYYWLVSNASGSLVAVQSTQAKCFLSRMTVLTPGTPVSASFVRISWYRWGSAVCLVLQLGAVFSCLSLCSFPFILLLQSHSVNIAVFLV